MSYWHDKLEECCQSLRKVFQVFVGADNALHCFMFQHHKEAVSSKPTPTATGDQRNSQTVPQLLVCDQDSGCKMAVKSLYRHRTPEAEKTGR